MKALITGISGQDGFYTARRLLNMGFDVIGLTSNESKVDRILSELDSKNASVHILDYGIARAIFPIIESFDPDLVFNFAAKSTGSGMFDAPFDMSRLNGAFVLDILEAIRAMGARARFVQASSAEMYGDAVESPQHERTPMHPKSPYGAAKVYAHNLIGVYRQAFGVHCSSAILFNHESTRRSTDFVTRKIARGAALIARGRANELRLGGIDTKRDWGYAPEYAEAMIAMALAEQPGDYVIATGRLTSIARACEICFAHVGLDYRKYVVTDAALQRNIRTLDMCGDATLIRQTLGWIPHTPIERVLIEMVDHELDLIDRQQAQ